jgi:putative acetyltransferase
MTTRLPPLPVLIRPLLPGEELALWPVFYASIHELAKADYSAEQLAAWAPAAVDQERWIERIRGIRPFVAEAGGAIAGYSDLQPTGYIDHFYVAPAWARRGVGSALMAHIDALAAERRLSRLFSNVSLTARPFFERFGFFVRTEQTVINSGVELRNFRMEKEQPAPSD